MQQLIRTLCLIACLCAAAVSAAPRTKIILDTDIGTDIDDAYALAVILHRSDLELLGVTTVSSDAIARASLAAKLVSTAKPEFARVPIYAGTSTAIQYMRQVDWADGFNSKTLHRSGAVEFIVKQIERYPNEITLIAIGELTNIAAVLRADPGIAKHIHAIALMGGSINRGYHAGSPPEPEWNIKTNVEAAKVVFASGVPLYVAPLDSTADLKLDAKRREEIFSAGTPFNDALAALDFIWINTKTWDADAPILFDVLAVQLVGARSPCPLTSLHVEVTDEGLTRVIPNVAPNANVALQCDSSAVLDQFVHLLKAH